MGFRVLGSEDANSDLLFASLIAFKISDQVISLWGLGFVVCGFGQEVISIGVSGLGLGVWGFGFRACCEPRRSLRICLHCASKFSEKGSRVYSLKVGVQDFGAKSEGG